MGVIRIFNVSYILPDQISYPNKRYYGGCKNVDSIESIAIERAKKLFGAEHVNVQPHSGSQANMAVYMTVLETGDTILTEVK